MWNENSLRDLWDNIEHTNICIIRVSEGKEREKGSEKIFVETIPESFTHMGKEIVNHLQEAQRAPGRINQRRNTRRYAVIKLKNLKTR